MIKERIKLLKLIKNLKINKACLKENDEKKIGDYVVKERFGADSAYGEVFNACHISKGECEQNVAIKKIPLNKKEQKYILEKNVNESTVLTEIKILNLVNELVLQNVSPNLPIVFKYFLCDDGVFRSDIKNIKNPSRYVFIVNEKATGDFINFTTKIEPPLKYMINAYFQIFTGIYCLKKYLNIYHNDLHWGNVLYHKIDNKSKNRKYITYKLSNDLTVTIKNMGYLFTLWDFGLSYIPKKIIKNKPKNAYNWKTDYRRIISMLFLDSEQTNKDYHLLGVEMIYILSKSINNIDFLYNIKTKFNLDENYQKTDYYYDLTKKLCTSDKSNSKFITPQNRSC